MRKPAFRHAVVAGAGIAGLLAARVLSDHFERVTLVERDRLPSRPEPRKGVAQGRHVHLLLPRGLYIIEARFPGLTEALQKAGALRINAGRDIAWFHGGDWRMRFGSDLDLVAATRPLIEAQVGERVRALPNVVFREGAHVESPTVDKGVLTGVGVRDRRREETIAADLLVDATGRGSRLPRWLEQSGYASPATASIQAPLTYSTFQFPRPEPGPGWQALVVNGPGEKRAAFCLSVEGDRWIVTLASLFEAPPPRDREAFSAFAKSLPVPDLHDAIGAREPLSEIAHHRFPESRWRRYERLRAHPAGLIAIGDSICSFNPVYGQGMTVAALEAEALDLAVTDARRRGDLDERFVRSWYRRIAAVLDVAWQGVAIEDYRFSELARERPLRVRALQWYMSRIHRATHTSAEVTDRFYRVIGFLEPPAALFRPRIVASVLRSGRNA